MIFSTVELFPIHKRENVMKNGYKIDWTSEAERNGNRIVIITLFDNRQNTDNLRI